MCGIFLTNFDLRDFDITDILKILKIGNSNYTSAINFKNLYCIHTLEVLTQLFYNDDKTIMCFCIGRLYNLKEFDNYKTDSECIISLYLKYGAKFIDLLDGEFALILVDFTQKQLIFSTDIIGTKTLWIGFDGKNFALSSYKTCLEKINFINYYQVFPNKIFILDLNNINIISEQNIHTFDLKEYKINLNDWNNAFINSIKKRTSISNENYFINMDDDIGSLLIICELYKQNKKITVYQDIDKTNIDIVVLEKNNIINVIEKEHLNEQTFLKNNIEEYIKNILINDNKIIKLSSICHLAKQNKNKNIFLSSYVNDKLFDFYIDNIKQTYLINEEIIMDIYGIECRYPFLDKQVIQEYLWLQPLLKKNNYENLFQNYLNLYKSTIVAKNSCDYFSKLVSFKNINNKLYSFLKSNNTINFFNFKNGNINNTKPYFILFIINKPNIDRDDYFNILEICTYYEFIPKAIISDNNYLFMNLKNIKLINKNEHSTIKNILTESRIIICDDQYVDIQVEYQLLKKNMIDDIRNALFDASLYDDDFIIMNNDNPDLSFHILSVGSSQFKYCFESLLSQKINFIIKIIKNKEVYTAMNILINTAVTRYVVQVDEDMIFLNSDCGLKMLNTIKLQNNDIWCYCFSLIDYNFGTGIDYQILGIKIFDCNLIKKYNLCYTKTNSFAIDRNINKLATSYGLKISSTFELIGYHQKYPECIDLFLRCAKISKELCEPLKNWGNYEFGIFVKYLSEFDFLNLLYYINYILLIYNKYYNEQKSIFDCFIDKIKNIKKPDYYHGTAAYHVHHVNYDKKDNYDKLLLSTSMDIKNSIPTTIIKNNNYYCLSGLLYSFIFEYVYDYTKYPYELVYNKL